MADAPSGVADFYRHKTDLTLISDVGSLVAIGEKAEGALLTRRSRVARPGTTA